MKNVTLEELLKKQRELDQYIIEKHGLEGTDLLGDKVTALIVEAAELANEIRGFKYWSNKGPDYDKAKEEYVDCLHFMLNIGNELFLNAEEIAKEYDRKYKINIERQRNGY